MKCLLYSALIMFLACCNRQEQKISANTPALSGSKDTLLIFRTFSMRVPKTWESVSQDSIPQLLDMTARAIIRASEEQMIYIEHGNGAEERSWDMVNPTYAYQQIAGYKAMIFEQSNSSRFFIGLFIDSVGVLSPVGKYGFSMYADGIDSSNRVEFLQAIKTIKIDPLD